MLGRFQAITLLVLINIFFVETKQVITVNLYCLEICF